MFLRRKSGVHRLQRLYYQHRPGSACQQSSYMRPAAKRLALINPNLLQHVSRSNGSTATY